MAPETLEPESVLLQEMESLEWQMRRLEKVAVIRFTKWMGNRATRLYQRLGHMLLRTPLAGVVHKLMGHIGPEEKYRRWLMLHRAADSGMNAVVAAEMAESGGPLISVVMPLYRPSLPWLKDAVESVRKQSYPGWQLLLSCDGDPEREIQLYIEGLLTEDPRIQCVSGDRGGISSTLNCGLRAAEGTYTAFLDQDDTLEPSALAHVAGAILDDGPDVIYTDEDYIDADGASQLPVFKPAWSPALLLSGMYLCHLLVVKTVPATAIGGFRTAHDGAQDYDLVLRLTDERASVVHIPRVLYHWRQHAGSTALHPSAKPYSHLAGMKALEETVSRRRLDATVQDGPNPNAYRLVHSSSKEDSAAVIIPTRNPRLLSEVLRSLNSRRNEIRIEKYVVLHCQGGEADAEIKAIAEKDGARLIEYHGPFNFALMNNMAATGVASPYLVFMNDDLVIPKDGWLDDLCAPFVREGVGIVGAQLLYPDGAIQHSGIVVGVCDGVGHSGRFQFGSPYWPWLGMTRNVSAVTGACLAIRRTLFAQLGGFDTQFPNNYNDVDLCLRAQCAGSEVVLSCESPLEHDEGRTRPAGTDLRERIAIRTKWGNVLSQADYFYSPNLSGRLEEIDLAAPR